MMISGKNLLHNLSLEIINTNSIGLEKFLQICIKTLDKMAPIKKKYVRGNNMPFFNKELSGSHKKRTQLRNRFLKKRSNQNKKPYSKQIVFLYLGKQKDVTMLILIIKT